MSPGMHHSARLIRVRRPEMFLRRIRWRRASATGAQLGSSVPVLPSQDGDLSTRPLSPRKGMCWEGNTRRITIVTTSCQESARAQKATGESDTWHVIPTKTIRTRRTRTFLCRTSWPRCAAMTNAGGSVSSCHARIIIHLRKKCFCLHGL